MHEQSKTLKISNNSQVSATGGHYHLLLSAYQVPDSRTASVPVLYLNVVMLTAGQS